MHRLIEDLAEECRREGRLSSSRAYGSLLRELRRWRGKDEIGWEDMDREGVRRFAAYMESRGLRLSTQSFFLGRLRSVLFKGRSKGLSNASAEWFETLPMRVEGGSERSQMVIPSAEVMGVLKDLDLEDEPELALVRDMFLFAFLCHGMELVDVAHLSHLNIREDNVLMYRRRLKGRRVDVKLSEEAFGILRRYAWRGRYLFPLLDGESLFSSKRNRVQIAMKRLGEMAGCPGLTFRSNIQAWQRLSGFRL